MLKPGKNDIKVFIKFETEELELLQAKVPHKFHRKTQQTQNSKGN